MVSAVWSGLSSEGWAVITDVWNWIEQFSGALTVLLAAAAVVPAVIAILSAKRDSRDRTRPVIVVEVQKHPHAERNLMLAVRNVGASVARSVSVTFDPALPTEATPTGHYAFYFGKMFADVIPTVPPGQTLANPWYSKDDTSAPSPCTIAARYTDQHGHPYVDSYVISVTPYLANLFIEASDSMPGRIKTLAEQAKEQTVALQAIAESLQQRGGDADLGARMHALQRLLQPGADPDGRD